MSKPTLSKFAVISFFTGIVFCFSFASELEALPYVEGGQSHGFVIAPSALSASDLTFTHNFWPSIGSISSGVSNVLASEASTPIGSASALSASLRAETIILTVIAFLAFVLVLRALGLRYYIEKNDQRDKAVEEEKAEQRRSLQSPKVQRPVESFTKRLELALGSQIPSDIALPSVFRAENSDLCGLDHVEVSEPALIDIEKSVSEDVNDIIDNALCDMHALIYNINVAIEKIHTNPLSSTQARSILIQSQMHARAIQYSLREIQSDLQNEDISKQRSA